MVKINFFHLFRNVVVYCIDIYADHRTNFKEYNCIDVTVTFQVRKLLNLGDKFRQHCLSCREMIDV